MDRARPWILFAQSLFILQHLFAAGQEMPNESINALASHPNWKLINYDKCGIAYTDRIIGGKNASMGSYPWIARIGYVKKDVPEPEKDLVFRCGGSVISELYIVTAAHCVTNLPNNTLVARIRLGEHNTETNPDCKDSFCNEPYEDFDPIEVTAHENYNNPKLRNDIALIRLNRKIPFSDFIKPICLMKGKLLTKNYVGQLGEVAGWGVYDINEPAMSTVLQKVRLPIVEQQRCAIGYRRVTPISSQQMCVGGKVGEDSCGGDSGGPLMKVDSESPALGPRYYLIGIVSFGARLCGETNLPGIYTRVGDYVPWILNHVKP